MTYQGNHRSLSDPWLHWLRAQGRHLPALTGEGKKKKGDRESHLFWVFVNRLEDFFCWLLEVVDGRGRGFVLRGEGLVSAVPVVAASVVVAALTASAVIATLAASAVVTAVTTSAVTVTTVAAWSAWCRLRLYIAFRLLGKSAH